MVKLKQTRCLLLKFYPDMQLLVGFGWLSFEPLPTPLKNDSHFEARSFLYISHHLSLTTTEIEQKGRSIEKENGSHLWDTSMGNPT